VSGDEIECQWHIKDEPKLATYPSAALLAYDPLKRGPFVV
jgi:hypothetical protein